LRRQRLIKINVRGALEPVNRAAAGALDLPRSGLQF
jgi:hypothetical protein